MDVGTLWEPLWEPVNSWLSAPVQAAAYRILADLVIQCRNGPPNDSEYPFAGGGHQIHKVLRLRGIIKQLV